VLRWEVRKTGKPTEEKEARYREQLAFYEEALREAGVNVARSRLLWL
jgi:predicted RecB family nuclease